MGYGLLSVKNNMETDAQQGLETLANQQSQQKRAEDGMEQAERSQKMSAVGTGAGFGMMAGMKTGAMGGPMGAAIGAGLGLIASELF